MESSTVSGKENTVNDTTTRKPGTRSGPVGGGSGGGGGYQIPWIEKYRPQVLSDVVGNEETLIRLSAIAKDGNLPNLILCGPPGTGKVGIVLIQHTKPKDYSMLLV
jgi:hypothetical protein